MPATGATVVEMATSDTRKYAVGEQPFVHRGDGPQVGDAPTTLYHTMTLHPIVWFGRTSVTLQHAITHYNTL